MAWVDIGGLDADSREWQLSQPFTGNLIRIDNDVSAMPPLINNFRGLIGLYLGLNHFFDIKQFFSIPSSQLILFQDFDIGQMKQLALRNISRTTKPNQWTIKAYVWDVIINPYVPNIIIDSDPVNLSSQSLTDIEDLINYSINNIAQQTTIINQQNLQILTLMTGGI